VVILERLCMVAGLYPKHYNFLIVKGHNRHYNIFSTLNQQPSNILYYINGLYYFKHHVRGI